MPANYNTQGQLVISGTEKGVAIACEKLLEAGARRAMPLKVGGAFHSPLMEPARIELAEAIHATKFNKGLCPIYQNTTGQSVTDPEIIKTALLGVPQIMLLQYGAVSQQVAEAMAIGLRKRFETDFAVAVTGIAGPDGGTIGKPVGTVWIAVADKTGVQSSIFHLGDLRMVNIRRAALAALNMLRLELVKKD